MTPWTVAFLVFCGVVTGFFSGMTIGEIRGYVRAWKEASAKIAEFRETVMR